MLKPEKGYDHPEHTMWKLGHGWTVWINKSMFEDLVTSKTHPFGIKVTYLAVCVGSSWGYTSVEDARRRGIPDVAKKMRAITEGRIKRIEQLLLPPTDNKRERT